MKAKKNLALLKPIQAIREKSKMSAYRIGEELAEPMGKSVSQIDTFKRHLRSGFDEEGQEVFAWCEVVAMMQLTGVHDPFFSLCDLLGYEHPQKVNKADEIARLTAQNELYKQQLQETQNRLKALESEKGDEIPIVGRFRRGRKPCGHLSH